MSRNEKLNILGIHWFFYYTHLKIIIISDNTKTHTKILIFYILYSSSNQYSYLIFYILYYFIFYNLTFFMNILK